MSATGGYLIPGDFWDWKPPEFPTIRTEFVHDWTAGKLDLLTPEEERAIADIEAAFAAMPDDKSGPFDGCVTVREID